MQLIPVKLQGKKRCFYCGTTKSVKYFFPVENEFFVEPLKLSTCNKCALTHIGTKMKTEANK